MYADKLRLTIHTRDGDFVGQGEVVEEGTAVVGLYDDGISLDDLMDRGTQAAHEVLGQPWPVVYNVRGVQGEAGGTISSIDIVVELLTIRDDLRALGWNVVAGLVLEEILRATRRKDGDDS